MERDVLETGDPTEQVALQPLKSTGITSKILQLAEIREAAPVDLDCVPTKVNSLDLRYLLEESFRDVPQSSPLKFEYLKTSQILEMKTLEWQVKAKL